MIKAEIVLPCGVQTLEGFFQQVPVKDDVVYTSSYDKSRRTRLKVTYIAYHTDGVISIFTHWDKVYVLIPSGTVVLLDAFYKNEQPPIRPKDRLEYLTPSDIDYYIKIMEQHKELNNIRFDEWYGYCYNKELEKLIL